MMKALIQTSLETMALRDVARPLPPVGAAVVEVKAVGISCADLRAFVGQDPLRPTPNIHGHEATGVVRGGADNGRRVAINPVVTCGDCEECSVGRTNLCTQRQVISAPPFDGAFAEFVVVPKVNLVTIPDAVTFAKAALIEPLARGWHAVRLCHATRNLPLRDKPCIVIGGSGIGVGAALALAAIGARKITMIEPNKARRAILQKISGFRTLAPDDPALASGAKIVIDTIGSEATRKQSCALASSGGVIAHIGMAEDSAGLDLRRMTLHEIQFIGCWGYTTGDFRATAQAVFQNQLGTLDWFDTRPLSAGPQVFADLQAGHLASPKVILIP